MEELTYSKPTPEQLLPQDDLLNAAEVLANLGVVIIPLFEPETIPDLRQRFETELAAQPIFKSHKKFKPVAHEISPTCGTYTLGSFGGIGTPEIFHNRLAADLRLKAFQAAYPMFIALTHILGFEHTHLSARYDRWQLKPKGSQVGAESWHRDEGGCREGDLIFGGWINLDPDSQHFSCVPGSQPPANLDRKGRNFFLPPEKTKIWAKKYKHLFEIPPGCMIIFYQDILHEIVSKKIKDYHRYRQFTGFQLSKTGEPLEDNIKMLETQGLPTLPGGMVPPMFAKNHASYHLDKILIPWTELCIKEKYTEQKTNKNGRTYRIAKRFMDYSLVEEGRPFHYTDEDRSIMLPNSLL